MVSINKIYVDTPQLLRSGHAQTILGAFGKRPETPQSTPFILPLGDGDQLYFEVTKPDNWKESDPTILMIHGLGGSSRSLYLQRLIPHLLANGFRTIGMNLRGSGPGEQLAKKMYHGGISNDLFAAIQEIKKLTPKTPLTILGYSLGGNLLLKLLGELGASAIGSIEKAIAVCPAINLYESAKRISEPRYMIYNEYYIRSLVNHVKKRNLLFPELPTYQVSTKMNLVDFDNHYTSVVWNFKNALDYYEKSSAKNYVCAIQVPCNVLFSRDDPVVTASTIHSANWSNHVTLWEASRGGHMGFISWTGKEFGYRWMDQKVMQMILDF